LKRNLDEIKANPEIIRKSHIVRQIEEGVLGVRKEDFDSSG